MKSKPMKSFAKDVSINQEHDIGRLEDDIRIQFSKKNMTLIISREDLSNNLGRNMRLDSFGKDLSNNSSPRGKTR